MSPGTTTPAKPKTAVLSWQERQQALRMEQMIVGLAQPHRGGSESKLRESALGRFVEDYQCGGECYRAGIMYNRLVWKWRLATGAKVPQWVKDEFGGSGGPGEDCDDSDASEIAERIKEWNATIRQCDSALKAVLNEARAMIFEDLEPSPKIATPLKRGLLDLCIALGLFPY